MKAIKKLGWLAVCLMLGTTATQAQEPKQLPHEIPSPEKAARKETDRMKKELNLTDKQYAKLYKLNLQEQKERFSAFTERPRGPRPPMGEHPGMDGGRPPMDMPGEPPAMPGNPPAMDKDSGAKLQKAAAKKQKKLKKILTEEQFAKWQTMQPEQPPHAQHSQY